VTYGFDEIALVPGRVTVNPNEVDTTFRLPRKNAEPLVLKIPVLASAMDGVVDVRFAIEMSKLGGLAVLNLEGVQTRYKNPKEVLQKVVDAEKSQVTALLQKIYQEPVQENLIAARIKQIKDSGALAAVSSIPQRAAQFGKIAEEAGADVFVVQSTVSTVKHISSEYQSLDLERFCREMRIPVIVGNTVGYDVTFEIMECGVAAVLIGVGPGAACTSRGVLGLGVPQVTATVDCAAARDAYFKKTSRYVPIITDGGMSKGGDVCKALACGADAVMVGSAFARAQEAPGAGYHWGMATPHVNLPRGTRIKVGTTGSLKQILFGPAEVDDGSQNLVGAITTCMGNVGARTIAEFQQTEIIIAPSIRTEGKLFQTVQSVGMGTS
jgi:IMP dehydrogenase